MRPDLHREYKHPTTGLVARLNDIAKDFNLSTSCAANRLKKGIPLDEPPRRVVGVRAPKPPKKGRVVPVLFNHERKVLAINPITGDAQNKHQLAKSLGITVEHARNCIALDKVAKIKIYTDLERKEKATRKEAAKEEMAKVIAALDERKAAMNHG